MGSDPFFNRVRGFVWEKDRLFFQALISGYGGNFLRINIPIVVLTSHKKIQLTRINRWHVMGRCRFFKNLKSIFPARVMKVVRKNMFHNFFLSSHRLLRSKLIRINTDTYFALSHKKFQVIRLNRLEEMASCSFF